SGGFQMLESRIAPAAARRLEPRASPRVLAGRLEAGQARLAVVLLRPGGVAINADAVLVGEARVEAVLGVAGLALLAVLRHGAHRGRLARGGVVHRPAQLAARHRVAPGARLLVERGGLARIGANPGPVLVAIAEGAAAGRIAAVARLAEQRGGLHRIL